MCTAFGTHGQIRSRNEPRNFLFNQSQPWGVTCPTTPDSCEIGEPKSRSVATTYYQRDLIFLTAVVGLRLQDKPCLDNPLECGYGARELFVLVN